MAYMLAYREAGISYARYCTILSRAVTHSLKEPTASLSKEGVTAYDYIATTYEGARKVEVHHANYTIISLMCPDC